MKVRENLSSHRPPGWGQPPFTEYAEGLWANTVATFANKPEAQRLCRIDDLMLEVASEWKAHESVS
jgi:hypothetical protein